MYAKYSSVIDGKSGLKHFHHIKIDQEFKQDLRVWVYFLLNQSHVARPFVDTLGPEITSVQLRFYTDASKAKSKGFGCVFGCHWTFGIWENNFIDQMDPSIAFLELFALVMAIFVWAAELKDIRIRIFCDNQSVISMVNNLTSGCKQCMKLIRLLTLNNLQWNHRVFVSYIDTKQNSLADSLSRGQMTHFYRLTKNHEMDIEPTQLSTVLWPLTRLWSSEWYELIDSLTSNF